MKYKIDYELREFTHGGFIYDLYTFEIKAFGLDNVLDLDECALMAFMEGINYNLHEIPIEIRWSI